MGKIFFFINILKDLKRKYREYKHLTKKNLRIAYNYATQSAPTA